MSDQRRLGAADPFEVVYESWKDWRLKRMEKNTPAYDRVVVGQVLPFLAMGPPPDPVTKAAPLGDVLKEREDRAQELLDTTPESTLLIMYKLLYARGVRISSIDHDINTAIKKEEA